MPGLLFGHVYLKRGVLHKFQIVTHTSSILRIGRQGILCGAYAARRASSIRLTGKLRFAHLNFTVLFAFSL